MSLTIGDLSWISILLSSRFHSSEVAVDAGFTCLPSGLDKLGAGL